MKPSLTKMFYICCLLDKYLHSISIKHTAFSIKNVRCLCLCGQLQPLDLLEAVDFGAEASSLDGSLSVSGDVHGCLAVIQQLLDHGRPIWGFLPDHGKVGTPSIKLCCQKKKKLFS